MNFVENETYYCETPVLIKGFSSCEACCVNWECYSDLETAQINDVDFSCYDLEELYDMFDCGQLPSMIEKTVVAALEGIKTRTRAKYVRFTVYSGDDMMKEFVAVLFKIGFILDVIGDHRITFDIELGR